jgi:hypothetical protein
MKKIVMTKIVLSSLVFTILVLGSGFAHAAGDMDIGLPMYPGAKQDPANPPVNAPHMKNLHLLTSDPFQKVLDWYTQKLGKFTVDPQKGGTQALWDKKTPDGVVMTVTVTNIKVPPGQTKIVMTKFQMKK